VDAGDRLPKRCSVARDGAAALGGSRSSLTMRSMTCAPPPARLQLFIPGQPSAAAGALADAPWATMHMPPKQQAQAFTSSFSTLR